jgi:hypothetical protein
MFVAMSVALNLLAMAPAAVLLCGGCCSDMLMWHYFVGTSMQPLVI